MITININKLRGFFYLNKSFKTIFLGLFPTIPSILSYIYHLKIPIQLFAVTLATTIALFIYLLFAKYFKKYSIKQGVKEIFTCLLLSVMTSASLGIIMILQNRDQRRMKNEISTLLLKEQELLLDYDNKYQSYGLSSFYSHNYTEAAKEIKAHLADPIAQYYYGYMLFYGLGMQIDENTGLKYIRSSADKNFYRAMTFMVEWGKFYDIVDIIPYAEKLVYAYPDSVHGIMYEDSCLEILKQQYNMCSNSCIMSYNLLYNYYAFTDKNYYKLLCLINDFDFALRKTNSQTHNIFYIESTLANAWGIWHLESKFLAKLYMFFNSNIRYTESFDAHFQYALMLLNISRTKDDNYENISIKDINKINIYIASRELDKSLKIAIDKKDIKSQINALQILSYILNYSGHQNEADNLLIIESILKQKQYYEQQYNKLLYKMD
jgi:hypothetical protein